MEISQILLFRRQQINKARAICSLEDAASILALSGKEATIDDFKSDSRSGCLSDFQKLFMDASVELFSKLSKAVEFISIRQIAESNLTHANIFPSYLIIASSERFCKMLCLHDEDVAYNLIEQIDCDLCRKEQLQQLYSKGEYQAMSRLIDEHSINFSNISKVLNLLSAKTIFSFNTLLDSDYDSDFIEEFSLMREEFNLLMENTMSNAMNAGISASTNEVTVINSFHKLANDCRKAYLTLMEYNSHREGSLCFSVLLESVKCVYIYNYISYNFLFREKVANNSIKEAIDSLFRIPFFAPLNIIASSKIKELNVSEAAGNPEVSGSPESKETFNIDKSIKDGWLPKDFKNLEIDDSVFVIKSNLLENGGEQKLKEFVDSIAQLGWIDNSVQSKLKFTYIFTGRKCCDKPMEHFTWHGLAKVLAWIIDRLTTSSGKFEKIRNNFVCDKIINEADQQEKLIKLQTHDVENIKKQKDLASLVAKFAPTVHRQYWL